MTVVRVVFYSAALAALTVTASSAVAQRSADTVVTIDTSRAQARVDAGAGGSDRRLGFFERLRPADALGLIEVGGYGQAVAPTAPGRSRSLGGGARIGVLLPFGFEAELDGSYGRLGGDRTASSSSSAAYAARVLSNWDFGNRSSMFFGGGVVRGMYQDRYATGASAILGYRVGEGVALRVDAVANFMPRPATTDLGFRAGVSFTWGDAMRTPYDGRGMVASTPVTTVTRTVVITRVDTVVRTIALESSAGSPAPRSAPASPVSSGVARGGGSAASAVSAARTTVRSNGDVADVRAPGAPRARKGMPDLTIHFGFNRASLTPAARDRLRRVAGRARADTMVRIDLAGFADQCGTETTNDAISRARAEAVEQYLHAAGIDRTRITTNGLGERDLVVARRTPDGRLPNRPPAECASVANRRVEVRTGAASATVGRVRER